MTALEMLRAKQRAIRSGIDDFVPGASTPESEWFDRTLAAFEREYAEHEIEKPCVSYWVGYWKEEARAFEERIVAERIARDERDAKIRRLLVATCVGADYDSSENVLAETLLEMLDGKAPQ